MSRATKSSLIDLVARAGAARGLILGRERWLALILCGDVLVAGERCREPKRKFPENAIIEFQDLPTGAGALTAVSDCLMPLPPRPFVSRGGDKLEAVLAAWQVLVAGRVWLDAGCSTGGFSHCLLLRGAALVHAVDVGYNQLDWRLRQHPAVAVHERTNIMGLELLDPPAAAAVADLSFRSMAGAAAKILALTRDNELYALIKPQFERKYFLAGKSPDDATPESATTFAGVVSPHETQAILEDVVTRLAAEGIALERISPAGLKGRTGNQEYIALLRRDPAGINQLASQGFEVISQLFA